MKIVKNTTASPVAVSDTGVTLDANASYTIPEPDYLLWAASSDIVTKIGNGILIINDGSSNLSISDGIDLIKGIFPRYIIGGTSNQKIGNISDKLKVHDTDIISAMTTLNGNIHKSNEVSVTNRSENDVPNTTYTIPTGKQFRLTNFSASYDAQAAMYVRVKKQTGGTGAFTTIARLTLMSGGQGNSTLTLNYGTGVIVGGAGDVFKITFESSLSKGSLWASFGGSEF